MSKEEQEPLCNAFAVEYMMTIVLEAMGSVRDLKEYETCKEWLRDVVKTRFFNVDRLFSALSVHNQEFVKGLLKELNKDGKAVSKEDGIRTKLEFPEFIERQQKQLRYRPYGKRTNWRGKQRDDYDDDGDEEYNSYDEYSGDDDDDYDDENDSFNANPMGMNYPGNMYVHFPAFPGIITFSGDDVHIMMSNGLLCVLNRKEFEEKFGFSGFQGEDSETEDVSSKSRKEKTVKAVSSEKKDETKASSQPSKPEKEERKDSPKETSNPTASETRKQKTSEPPKSKATVTEKKEEKKTPLRIVRGTNVSTTSKTTVTEKKEEKKTPDPIVRGANTSKPTKPSPEKKKEEKVPDPIVRGSKTSTPSVPSSSEKKTRLSVVRHPKADTKSTPVEEKQPSSTITLPEVPEIPSSSEKKGRVSIVRNVNKDNKPTSPVEEKPQPSEIKTTISPSSPEKKETKLDWISVVKNSGSDKMVVSSSSPVEKKQEKKVSPPTTRAPDNPKRISTTNTQSSTSPSTERKIVRETVSSTGIKIIRWGVPNPS